MKIVWSARLTRAKGPRLLPCILILLLATSAAWGQMQKMEPRGQSATRGIELGGFYGWQYGGDFTAYTGEVEVRDDESFGGQIDFAIPSRPGMKAELSYSRQNTKVTFKEFPTGNSEDLFDMSVEYFHAGALYEVQNARGRMTPFGIFSLGATRFAPKADSYQDVALDDEWRFSFALGLGLKAMFNDRLGLRLQARLLMPINFGSTSFWIGTGGASVGVGGGTAILQGDATGGLFVVL